MSSICDAILFSLFADLPTTLKEERFDILLGNSAFRLERILSLGHTTPDGRWYDQDWNEWVVLIQGEARLEIEGQPDEMVLTPGTGLLIPAHCRHRVSWTPADRMTLWLALHFLDESIYRFPSLNSGLGVSELTTREITMSEILIEKSISEDRLKDMGVRNWPIWTKEHSEFPWTYDATEVCYLLDGQVIVTPQDGQPVQFGAGDLVTFPQGLNCTWVILQTVRKHYNFF